MNDRCNLIIFILILIMSIDLIHHYHYYCYVNNVKAVYRYCYHYYKYCQFNIFIKVLIFGGLIDFTRQENLDLKNILMTSLREGRKFIDLFLCQKSSHLISVMFSERENQTLKLLSKLQKSTRQLQALCTHGKLRRYVRIQPLEDC